MKKWKVWCFKYGKYFTCLNSKAKKNSSLVMILKTTGLIQGFNEKNGFEKYALDPEILDTFWPISQDFVHILLNRFLSYWKFYCTYFGKHDCIIFFVQCFVYIFLSSIKLYKWFNCPCCILLVTKCVKICRRLLRNN